MLLAFLILQLFSLPLLNLLSTRLKRPVFHCSLREFSWVCLLGVPPLRLHFTYISLTLGLEETSKSTVVSGRLFTSGSTPAQLVWVCRFWPECCLVWTPAASFLRMPGRRPSLGARSSWMLLEGAGVGAHSGNLGGGSSECGHLRVRVTNTPGAHVVSPLLPERSSYGGPAPPTTRVLPLWQPRLLSVLPAGSVYLSPFRL